MPAESFQPLVALPWPVRAGFATRACLLPIV